MTSSRTAALGTVAMTATVLAWAGFALSIRGIESSELTSADVALLRFGIPLLVLAPRVPRSLRALRRERPLLAILLVGGAGLPYFLVSSAGGAATSAALVGLVIPGSVPVFVALIGWARFRERPAGRHLVALGLIVAGVAAIVVLSTSSAAVVGVLVLLVGGLLWSVYTIAIRRSELDAIGVAVAVCAPSLLLTVVGIGTGILPSSLLAGTATFQSVLVFAIVQGLGVGVVAALGFTIAIRALGSARASAAGALSPVIVAIAAIPLFGEVPGVATVLGLVAVVTGVVLVNAPRRSPHPLVPSTVGVPR